MTPEQIADRDIVWKKMTDAHPEFTRAHDFADNYHAVREIVLGESEGWAGVHRRFTPAPGTRVMDVGANAGIYSAFCALKGAQVTAYEPFPVVFSKFRGMCEHTGISVEAINAAIWIQNGERPYIGNIDTLAGTCETYNGGIETQAASWVAEDFKIAKSVKCVSFEEAIGHVDWDCVKMDIEGAEFEVLLYTPPEALRRIRFMYLEFHPWANQELYEKTVEKLQSIFQFEGYFRNNFGRWESAYLTRREMP